MSKLWAITSYFNPSGYQRRIENYRIFREHLNIPLVTVELSFNGSFELNDSDADILVQVDGTDVMWQKERLLNLAASKLPKSCSLVAWLDCDVVFESKNWSSQAIRLLDNYKLIQLFHERMDMDKETTSEHFRNGNRVLLTDQVRKSAAYHYSKGFCSTTDYERPKHQVHAKATTGLAWAMHIETIQKHGFYDACIVGGGDRSIFAAAIGRSDLGVIAQSMSQARESHYLSWANAFKYTIQGKVSYLPGRLFHLWHGDFRDRNYVSRYGLLTTHDFDPNKDIRVGSDGIWKWSTDKPEFHQSIREYFNNRKEDGPTSIPTISTKR